MLICRRLAAIRQLPSRPHATGGDDAHVQGIVTRRTTMLRDDPGPRAAMNAIERLVGDCGRGRDDVLAGIGVKEGQLRECESQVGRPFEHASYREELADLRDQMKLGLSESPPEGATPVAELAERITALRESNTVEAAPERSGGRQPGRAVGGGEDPGEVERAAGSGGGSGAGGGRGEAGACEEAGSFPGGRDRHD